MSVRIKGLQAKFSDAYHDDKEIPPTHILATCANLVCLLTSQIPQQRPCYKGCEHLCERPVDREDRKQVLMAAGQELKKDGAVNGQVAADTNTPEPIAAKFGLPAAIIPKTAVIPMVRLNAQRRPKMSQPNPQNTAPKRSPMFCDSVRSGGRSGSNSFLTGVNRRDVTIGQRLFIAQPKPITTKRFHWYRPMPTSCIAWLRTRALAA